jgi:uncharacterized protein YndB with AHSA1/START domain/DNA-binding transcriptional ArsR family regulator
MGDVFKALADVNRRTLLDRLFKRDGQTLAELCEHIDLTRFGTMKHLRILQEARLVTFRRVGREKLHYLNPIPIRTIQDRWISKYAKPVVDVLVGLKHKLENPMNKSPRHVYEVFIRTTPEKLWAAITESQFTRQYFYGCAVESTWKVGAALNHKDDGGDCMLEGRVLEVEPPRRLVHTFHAAHDPEQKKDRPSRVTWEIKKRGEVCQLTLVHDDFDGETETFKSTGPGWNPVLSGLKTLLETGQPLVISPAAL